MKIAPCLVFLLLCSLIYSCSKDSVKGNNSNFKFTYNTLYHKSGMKLDGTVRVFASTGEVKDMAVVDRFAERDSVEFNSQVNYVGYYQNYWDSVIFTDAGHATVINYYDAHHVCLVNHTGDMYVLSRADTSSGSTYTDVMSRTVGYYISQVKPDVYSETLVSSTAGNFVFNYTATEKFVLDISGEGLFMPLIVFRYYDGRFPNSYSGTTYINNVLQEDFFKNLNKGDTVTLCEYVLTYEN